MWKYNCTLFCSVPSVNRVEQFMTSFISYGFFKIFCCNAIIMQVWINYLVHLLYESLQWCCHPMLWEVLPLSICMLSMFSCRYYKSMNAYKIDIRLGCIYTSVTVWLLWRWQIVNAPIVLSSIILWFKGLSHWSKLQW